MEPITIFSKPGCAYCANSKRLLQSKGIAFHEVDLSKNPALEQELVAQTNFRTVPKIFVEGALIGGFKELVSLNTAGKLDHLYHTV